MVLLRDRAFLKSESGGVMLETASTKQQRRRPDSYFPTRAIDNSPQHEGDLSPSITSAAHKPVESRMNRIALRAHEIYEARGGEQGKALEDWLQAEREIDLELAAESSVAQ
jgi:hypothetical protein